MKKLSRQEAEDLEREMQNPPKSHIRRAVNPKRGFRG